MPCPHTHLHTDITKLWTLLEAEQKARKETLQNIDAILGSKTQDIITEEVLIAFKNYLFGIQVLTDIIRLQFVPAAALKHDTDPQHMNLDEKAPDTERSTRQ